MSRVVVRFFVALTLCVSAGSSFPAFAAPEADDATAKTRSVLDELGYDANTPPEKTSDGLRIVEKPKRPPAVRTQREFKTVVTTQAGASSAPPGDPNVIERPDFQTIPKRLVKNLSSVTSMMVTIGEDGQQNGFTSDIIATIPAKSRAGNTAGAGFLRDDSDITMRVAFEEAARAVQLRYPLWEPGHIDISFGEKFVAHGGPSAGTAFGLLMLSCLEGFDIDPKCAVTGDITVDWKVRKVGGVTAKLRGATLDKCNCALIPEGNEAAFADMALLYSKSALWDIQVFSIANLQQAQALITRFQNLQARFATTFNDPAFFEKLVREGY